MAQQNLVVEPLETSIDWTSAESDEQAAWTWQLTPSNVLEVREAVRHAQSRQVDLISVSAADFPLPTVGDLLDEVKAELIDGRGFVRLRGLPLDDMTEEEATWAYWGIGMHLGRPWPQNARGHILGNVTDEGVDPNSPNSRGYQMGEVGLPFHCDGSDLVGLMCLRTGRSGGESRISNAVRAHNILVQTEPELAAALYEPLPYDFRGEERDGARGWYEVPAFTRVGDRLFVRLIAPFVYSSQRHDDAPRLSEVHKAAMHRFDELINATDNWVEMAFQPGDIQFINNYHVMHGRAPYVDYEKREHKRLLKRLWLETDCFDSSTRPQWARNRMDHWIAARRGTLAS